MKIELDKINMKRIKKDIKIIKDNYPEPWKVYILSRSKNHSKLGWIVNDWVIGAGQMKMLESLGDTI